MFLCYSLHLGYLGIICIYQIGAISMFRDKNKSDALITLLLYLDHSLSKADHTKFKTLMFIIREMAFSVIKLEFRKVFCSS